MVRDVHENPLFRRQRLLMRSAALRITMAGQSQVMKAPLAVADQVRAGLRWLHRHPELPLGALVALAVLRPQRALRWTGRILRAWTAFRRAQAWLEVLPLRIF